MRATVIIAFKFGPKLALSWQGQAWALEGEYARAHPLLSSLLTCSGCCTWGTSKQSEPRLSVIFILFS